MNSSYNNQTSDEDSGFERYCDVSEYDLYYLDTVESSPPSISSPIEQSLLPMSNPIEQSQLLMCNPNEQNQLSISNPIEQSQLPMSNPIEQSLLPMSNPIEHYQTNTLFHNRIYEDSSTHFANDDNLHYYRNKLNLNFPRNQDKDYHKNSCCINQNCNQHCNPDSFGISNVSIHPNVNASAMYFSRHRALFDVLPRQKRRQNFGPESFQNKYYQILSGHKLNKEKVQQIHNEFLVRDLHFNKMRSCEFRSIKKYFKKYEEKQDEIINYLQENRKRIVARFGII